MRGLVDLPSRRAAGVVDQIDHTGGVGEDLDGDVGVVAVRRRPGGEDRCVSGEFVLDDNDGDVRGLDDGVKQQLAAKAKEHGRSMEAEVRDILTNAARRPHIGMALLAAA